MPCSDGWVSGAAPMQDSAEAQDELFDAAAQKSLLIAPSMEPRALWTMRNDFRFGPTMESFPGLVSQIVFLINRYLHDPKRAGTSAKLRSFWSSAGHRRIDRRRLKQSGR